jgi:cell wall-associated NlpC family hydrolase
MRVRGRGRRVTLVAACAVVAAASLGVAAHADPGGSGSGRNGSGGYGYGGGDNPAPNIPGQGAVDRAEADVRARQVAVDGIQASLTAADRTLHGLEAAAGLAAEAYDTAVAQAATATRAASDAQGRAAAALDVQRRAEHRLGAFAAEMYREGPDMAKMAALLHADSLHDFATRQQALVNYDAAGALAVREARQASREAGEARQKAEQAVRERETAEAQARMARDRAQSAAVASLAQVSSIRAQRESLLGQLAAAQGVALGLERQRQAGLAEAAARAEAARRAAAAAAAGGGHKRAPGSVAGAPGSGHGLSAPPNADAAVRIMLNYVYAQLGKPYVWGGAGPDVFDCSGLAMRALEAAGWSFPHPAQWQYLAMHPVTYNQLRPGDLVFWAEDDSNPHTIYHEAIYIGHDRIIQAPRPGGVVEQQSLWVNGTPSFYGRP